jgi:sporulation protein YlmC with PRC-barrel domain
MCHAEKIDRPGTVACLPRFREHNVSKEDLMRKLTVACALLAACVTAAHAATTLTSVPAQSSTVTNYYKQSVYDPKQNKIGDIDDVLVDNAGKITGLVIGVGGFLGMDEKDVIVPFSAVKSAKKDNKWWLTLDETKDSLKNSAGFQYDKTTTTWEPAKK